MKKQVKHVKRNTFDGTALFREIRELILSARSAVVRKVDTIQVITNFEIGRRIVEYEQGGKIRAEYGEKTLAEISQKLTQEFGHGFSKTNLKLMRKFFLMYGNRIGQTLSDQLADNQKGQTLSGQLQKTQVSSAQLVKTELLSRKFTLSWSHYIKTLTFTRKNINSICRQKRS